MCHPPGRPLAECRVLVSPTSFGLTDPSLKTDLEAAVGEVLYNRTGRPLASAQVRDLLPEVDGYIAGLDEIDAPALALANRLRVIARYGVGVDRVDLAAATRLGVVVTNTPGANSGAVAELAIGLMLTLARGIHRYGEATRAGGWPRGEGLALEGKTVGLVGLGAIGREVARRLVGFGCRLLAMDPLVDPGVAASLGVDLISLEELLPQAHFVSLHAPATPATVGLVNAVFLGRMRPGAFLINTARGELVDELALLAALTSGRLAGAALDCFRQEPPNRDNPLLALPQVVATPHLAAHTDAAMNQMGRISLACCLAVLKGERPLPVVNPQVYETRMEHD